MVANGGRGAGHRTLQRGLTTKIHVASTSAKFALGFSLSPGNNHDAPEGWKLLELISSDNRHYLLIGKDGIGAAEYWTTLPPKAELEQKIHAILAEARERLSRRNLLLPGILEEGMNNAD